MTDYGRYGKPPEYKEPVQESPAWVKQRKDARKRLLQSVWRRRTEYWKTRLRKLLK